jgi:hypothetical protein
VVLFTMASAYILSDIPYTIYTIARVAFDARVEPLLVTSQACRACVIIIKLFVYYAFKGLYRRRLNRLVKRFFGCGSSNYSTDELEMWL